MLEHNVPEQKVKSKKQKTEQMNFDSEPKNQNPNPKTWSPNPRQGKGHKGGPFRPSYGRGYGQSLEPLPRQGKEFQRI